MRSNCLADNRYASNCTEAGGKGELGHLLDPAAVSHCRLNPNLF
ncbi:hypothetical protein [Desulfotignum balticum]|nr:hypothetical protein [Desulfotignum balticum]